MKFEYLVIQVNWQYSQIYRQGKVLPGKDVDAYFTTLGSEGWDLTRSDNIEQYVVVYIFKRPLVEK